MSAEWQFVLCKADGTVQTDVSAAAGKSIAFTRSSFHEARLTLSLEDAAAATVWSLLLNDGVPSLKAYRDGVLRFNGYLAPFQETAEDAATMALVFRSPFARLLGDGPGTGRAVSTLGKFEVTALDQAQAIDNLATAAQATAPANLATSVVTSSATTRNILCENGKNYGEAIQDLCKLDGGPEFLDAARDVAGAGTEYGRLECANTVGVNRPAARFEYGPETLANVRSVQRSVSTFVTRAYVFGAGYVGTSTNAAAYAKWGEWCAYESRPDIVDQTTADNRAAALLRPLTGATGSPSQVIQFSPDPVLAPQPFVEWYLGDTVQFFARRGAMLINTPVRVNSFTVVVDENGREAFEIPDPQIPDESAWLRSSVAVEVTT